jgi:hypothetical protein
MGRTARAVLVVGWIALLLGPTAALVDAAPVALDGVTAPSRLPASPPPSAERTALRAGEGLGLRLAIELIALALACAVAVAVYSATAGERGGTRVPARVRRR